MDGGTVNPLPARKILRKGLHPAKQLIPMLRLFIPPGADTEITDSGMNGVIQTDCDVLCAWKERINARRSLKPNRNRADGKTGFVN